MYSSQKPRWNQKIQIVFPDQLLHIANCYDTYITAVGLIT